MPSRISRQKRRDLNYRSIIIPTCVCSNFEKSFESGAVTRATDLRAFERFKGTDLICFVLLASCIHLIPFPLNLASAIRFN